MQWSTRIIARAMLWLLPDIHRVLAASLRRTAALADEEQAVRGLDSIQEVTLHGILAEGLRVAGYGITREVRYPSARANPRRTHGRRCDLVVAPEGRPLAGESAQGELFAQGERVPLHEALWLEVKVVAQFGEGGANRGYSALLQGNVWRDFTKLATDEKLFDMAQLIVLFGASREVVEHDLTASCERARQKGYGLDRPLMDAFPIPDRMGNGCCAVAVVGIHR